MNESINKFLHTRITEIGPQSLVVVGIKSGENAIPEIQSHDLEVHYLQSNEITNDNNRYDLGVIYLDKNTQESWSALSRSRDILTRHLIVIVPSTNDRPVSDFVALGMTRTNLEEFGDYAIYEYDVATYKSTPDWLSAESWANPDQWEKERW